MKLRCTRQLTIAPRNLTVAVTGASGSIFAKHLLDALDRDERVATVNLILSDSGLRVMAEELQVSGRNELIQKLLGRESQKIRQTATGSAEPPRVRAHLVLGHVAERKAHERRARPPAC